MLHRFYYFVFGYGLLVLAVSLIGYHIHSGPKEFTLLSVVLYVAELVKLCLDQVLVILFFKTMVLQKQQFDELFFREIPETRSYDLFKKLCRSTTWTLFGFFFFYEFRLVFRLMSDMLYTHNFIELVQPRGQRILNWIFFGQSVVSSLMCMAAGLLFFSFAYNIHQARVKQSLFGDGFLIEE